MLISSLFIWKQNKLLFFGFLGLSLYLMVSLITPSIAMAAGPTELTSIPNFQVISTELLRGAQPSFSELKQLSSKGVKTILNLRMSSHQSNKEAAMAKSLHMKYFHVPMGYTVSSDKSIQQALTIINNPDNQPVFIHCRQGADRTGTLTGIYRIVCQKWNFQEAYQEMLAHHFKPWLFTLKHTVASYARQYPINNEPQPISVSAFLPDSN